MPLNPALGRQRQVGFVEFSPSLAYKATVNSNQPGIHNEALSQRGRWVWAWWHICDPSAGAVKTGRFLGSAGQYA